jgi:hypothetical protein
MCGIYVCMLVIKRGEGVGVINTVQRSIFININTVKEKYI